MDVGNRLTRSQTLVDAAFGAACVVLVVGVHLSGSEAVPANRPVGMLSVTLTVLAVAPLVVRRRWPMAVLATTSSAALLMVVTKSTVGLATIGMLVAFYTAIGYTSRRRTWQALAIVGVALGLTVVLQPVDLSAEGAVVNLVCFGFAGTLGVGVRDRRERHAADVAAAEERAELDRRLAEQERKRADAIAVEERLRLTRELHDVIGHALSVMVVQAGVAERMLERRPDAARLAVGRIARTGRDSLGEMRRLLEVMRDGDGTVVPSRHPAPGVDDLQALVAEVRAAGLDVSLAVGPAGAWSEDQVPPALQLAVFRVVQEALTNCLKHSSGTRATVRVTRSDDVIEVEVVDDGRPAVDVVAGHGITGMRERVSFYDGGLVAGPRQGGGFGVLAELRRAPAEPSVESATP